MKKLRKSDGFIIETDAGLIHFHDKNKQWWLGGDLNTYIGLFKTKEIAQNVAKKIKKERPDLIHWYRILRVRFAFRKIKKRE